MVFKDLDKKCPECGCDLISKGRNWHCENPECLVHHVRYTRNGKVDKVYMCVTI
jgi:tRNA(Ile2) C34 agmatinyltransferase TiaS